MEKGREEKSKQSYRNHSQKTKIVCGLGYRLWRWGHLYKTGNKMVIGKSEGVRLNGKRKCQVLEYEGAQKPSAYGLGGAISSDSRPGSPRIFSRFAR